MALAGVLNTLGTKPTHLIVRKEKALRSFYPEISDFLDAQTVRQGIVIHRSTGGVAHISLASDGRKVVTTVSGERINVDSSAVSPTQNDSMWRRRAWPPTMLVKL